MAISISTPPSFFSSPKFTLNPNQSSHSISCSNLNSVRYGRSRISAAYATAERVANAAETSRSFGTFSTRSLYEVLGVQIGADTQEVKSAYRRLARVLHPDVGSCESSADEFMKVHSAYLTLADPVKRAEYDWSLLQRRMGGLGSMTYTGGCRSVSRRWETDQCW